MHTLREGEVVTLRPGQKVRVDYLEGDDWVIAPGPETLTPYGGNDHEELIAVTNRHDGFVMVPTRLVMVRIPPQPPRDTYGFVDDLLYVRLGNTWRLCAAGTGALDARVEVMWADIHDRWTPVVPLEQIARAVETMTIGPWDCAKVQEAAAARIRALGHRE